MESQRKKYLLASLIHNIGHFYGRVNGFDESLLIPELQEKANTSQFVGADGNHRYQHILWSCQFLLKYIAPYLKDKVGFSDISIDNTEDDESVFQLVLKSQTEGSLIYKSDCWALGTNDFYTRDSVDCKKLLSIYSLFDPASQHNIWISPERISTNIFPNLSDDPQSSKADYENTWNGFVNDFDSLPTTSFLAFFESLLFLMKKYMSNIPYIINENNFISLYEETKIATSIVDCIYVYSLSNNKNSTEELLLVGGDVVGIQSFIYNIASNKAAKSLKGRSFYVQLLVDSAIQRILYDKSINACYANVVYSSGGKFYLLLPNIKEVSDALNKEIQKSIEEELWNDHKGQLALSITQIPFTFSDEEIGAGKCGEKVSELWNEINQKFGKLKYRRFQSQLNDSFFEKEEVGAKGNVCAVTGIEESEKNCGGFLDEEDEKYWVLNSVKEQVDLGLTLKDTNRMLSFNSVSQIDPNKRDNYYVGIQNYWFDKVANKNVPQIHSFVRTFNDVDNFLEKQNNKLDSSYGFQFYGGNRQAINEKGKYKTYEELTQYECKNADGNLEKLHTYLGVLRMDVDDLGAKFKDDFPVEKRSFAGYSTLSASLDYFFSGYLNTIREEKDFRDCINIIYSGGDDIFALGRWDKLLVFAERIREDFRKYVGRNNNISISGGLVVVGNKFPIAKSALLAGEAEDKAKKGEWKNSITFLNHKLTWQVNEIDNSDTDHLIDWVVKNESTHITNEYAFVKANKILLKTFIEKGAITRALLFKLVQWRNLIKYNEEHNVANFEYIWNTAYYIARYISRFRNIDVNDPLNMYKLLAKKYCQKLKAILAVNKDNNFKLLALSARWAELELRIKNNN